MYKSVIITLVMCSFVSCTYNYVSLLSEKDLEWMEAYNDGDSVLFSAPDGRVDTMIVSRTVSNTPGKFGLYCFSDYRGQGIYENRILHNDHQFECFFFIKKDYQNQAYLTLYFERRSLICDDLLDDALLRPCDTSQVVVKGYVYNDAIMMNDNNSSISQESENNCEYFIWSKSKGLLQYKYLNGEVYTFYKKLPRKKNGWFQ